MLSFIALVWGILAIVGMTAGFLPYLAAWSWVNLPFAVLGASFGIVAIFTRKDGGSKLAVAGIALCMIASIAGMLRLVMMDSTY